MSELPSLEPLPEGFAASVASLHLVAERIVAPARKPDNEIALQATPGGFGTPVFEHGGSRHQVRVEGDELVHSEDGDERRAPLRTLATARSAVAELLPGDAELDDAPLEVDPIASRILAEWYGFAAALLEELKTAASAEDNATPAILWPEHFDIAIELGSEDAGLRANYGASPGDESHAQPYLYVGPWTAAVSGDLWRATSFTGAELSYSSLLAVADQGKEARDFFWTRRDALSEEEEEK
jgi:hypothetical protein